MRGEFTRILLTGSAQTIIQVLSLLCGFLAVRLLPVDEYAYYTVANAMLGTMNVLTDGGIAESVIAQGGKVWQSPEHLGAVIAAGLSLRRRFALRALAISLPLLYWLLRQQGAAATTALLVSASIVPAFASSFTNQLLEIAAKLHQRVGRLQEIAMSAAGLRLALVVAAATAHPVSWLVNVCASASQIWANWRIRRLTRDFADLHATPSNSAKTQISAQIRRTLPSAIYYAFSGQITVWLIAVLGNTQSVAQVGALGRLAAVFGVVSAAMSLLVTPRFARMQDCADVLRRFRRVQSALWLSLAVIVALIWTFPDAALTVLGPSYHALTHEVGLAAASGALSLLAGYTYSMAAARGVVANPWMVVPFAIALQVLLISVLPTSTVAGVLWLGIITNACYWAIHAANFVLFVRSSVINK
jgi:hypothetical protein